MRDQIVWWTRRAHAWPGRRRRHHVPLPKPVACNVLVEVGGSGDLPLLREAQRALAEGRRFAHRFNAEFQELISGARLVLPVPWKLL